MTMSNSERPGPAAATGTFPIGGDLPVTRLGFGAMRLTGEGVWGEPEDQDEARRVLRRAVELGVTLIDTADAYGPEVSERLIAEALYPYPEGLVIATKGGLARTGPGEWEPLGRPAYLVQQCELSRRRLRVDCIDLYQLHRIDPEVPAEEQLGVLGELQAAGKIRHIGLSGVTVEELNRARREVRIATVQNRYNLVERHHEPVLDACAEAGIGFIPFFPLAIGTLARPGGAVEAFADRHDATPAQLALAWLLHHSPAMMPIPGTADRAHLEENCRAAELSLGSDELQALAEAAESGLGVSR